MKRKSWENKGLRLYIKDTPTKKILLMSRPCRGFTLSELLMVVVIIAVLAAIIVPAAGIVRDSARSAQCQSNLRQYGLANSAYANDWKGSYVPVCVTDASASVITRWDTTADYMNLLKESSSAGTTGFNLTKGLMCPLNVAAKKNVGVMYSYSMNFTAVGGQSAYTASTTYALHMAQAKPGIFMIVDGAAWKIYNTNSSFDPYAWGGGWRGRDRVI
jgi:prepilin-type N-terminal cleavage/methylation domain-containing protein